MPTHRIRIVLATGRSLIVRNGEGPLIDQDIESDPDAAIEAVWQSIDTRGSIYIDNQSDTVCVHLNPAHVVAVEEIY